MATIKILRELVQGGIFKQEYAIKAKPTAYDRSLPLQEDETYLSSLDMDSDFAKNGLGESFKDLLNDVAKAAASPKASTYKLFYAKGAEAERLAVNCMHQSYVNLAAKFVVRLVPYVNTDYGFHYVVCHDAPEHMINPDLSLLNAFRSADRELMSASAALFADAVDFAFKLVAAKQLRPHAFAVSDVNSAQLKYGVFWLPNLKNQQVLDTIQALDARNNEVSMRMVTFNSRTDSQKLRYREAPMCSLLAMLVSHIIAELVSKDIKHAQDKMFFAANKLWTNREEAIAKHQELVNWAQANS